MNESTSVYYFEALLREGCSAIGLHSLSDLQFKHLLDYAALLQKWSTIHNLTTITDSREVIIKHLLDSLSLAPQVKASLSLDVGTGAGLPGIPLAIAMPNVMWHLLDANQKKITFVQYAIVTLGLKNVEVFHQRVEAYRPEVLYDGVFTRAFASIAESVDKAHGCINFDGLFYLMLGQRPRTEDCILPKGCKMICCNRIEVPFMNAQRHLVLVKPIGSVN